MKYEYHMKKNWLYFQVYRGSVWSCEFAVLTNRAAWFKSDFCASYIATPFTIGLFCL